MRRASGWLLLGLLLILAALKAQTGVLAEMLWVCHVTSALLALGLILELQRLSAVGFLFHLAVALPAYALDLASGGDTTWVSFLLHLLSPAFGWMAWRGARLPAATPWLALACYVVLAVICRAFTPAQMNINLAFGPWAPLAFMGIWPSRIGNLLLMLAQLATVQWLRNRRVPNINNAI